MNKKGKILLITTDFPPASGGGICTHSKFIVDSLRNLGWDFCILSEFYIDVPQNELNDFLKNYPFNIYKLPISPNLKSLYKKFKLCIKYCKQYKPDIVIGTGRHPAWFAAGVSFFCKIPLVTIGHGTEFTQKTSKYDFFLNKLAYGYSDVLISISKYTKEIVHKQNIKPKKIEVIYNSADENLFKPLDNEIIVDFKRKKGLAGKKIVLTVGNLSERKGQKLVIQAMPEILKNNPDVVYVAIGFPSIIIQLNELSNKLGVENHVLFPGIVESSELLLWLNACDVFTLPSIQNSGDYEGYGIAVVEAALCGKPAVVSDSAGLKEAVINDFTGIIVKENSSEQIAEALIKLLNDNNLLKQMSLNAYNYSIKNNTWSVKGKEYDKVLSELLLKK